ncbi:MAG: DUF2099 family protein [Candidatus Korarchaeum sp.]
MVMHELLCRGARVIVEGCDVRVLTDPAVSRCPYVRATYGIEEIDRDAVKRIVEAKIKEFGFFCPYRSLESDIAVPFGSSEMISSVMGELLDCAVVVCDGAGTVITSNPGLVQGIGARMNGLLRTAPIPEVIERIRDRGGEALEGEIDQVAGVKRAIERGFRRIAVTVIGPMAREIERLRELEEQHGVRLAIFSTCNTLVSEEDVKYVELADVVCASASRLVIERVGRRALMQLGVHIPVFILTDFGKRIALRYLEAMRSPVLVSRARMPFVSEDKLPKLKGIHDKSL